MKDTSKSAKCVGSRVDYLQIAFQVEFSAETLRALQHRSAAARDVGSNEAEIIVGQLVATLRVPRDAAVERWSFANADFRGVLGTREVGGWTIEFHLRAAFLATHTIEEAIELVERVAASLGVLHGRRLRRLDLCADFVGFDLDASMAGAFVKPRRGKLGSFRPEHGDEDDRGFMSPRSRDWRTRAAEVTGFAICPGNDASARVYDKTAELQLQNREEKRAIEHAQWSVRGWNGDAKVTRVEFQLRGVALDELDLRDPSARRLAAKLDPVWQYLVREWLRLIRVDSADRRDRCLADPRWLLVQDVVFRHTAQPAARSRKRGGATLEQAMGATLSALHGLRALPRVLRAPLDTEGQSLRDMTKDQRDAYLRSLCLTLGVTAAMVWANRLQTVHGIERAPEALAVRWNASWARFWSNGDRAMPAPWVAEPQEDGAWLLRLTESIGSAAIDDLTRDGLVPRE